MSRHIFATIAILSASFLWLSPTSTLAAVDVHCTPAQFWSPGFGAPPSIPFVADVDGDGYADLLLISLNDNASIDVSLNAAGQKPCYSRTAADNLGHDALAGTVGEFAGSKGADVLLVFADGAIRLAWNFNSENGRYDRTETVGKFPSGFNGPVLIAAGDMDADGRDEVVVVEKTGEAWLVSLSADEIPKAAIVKLGLLEKNVSAIALAETGKHASLLVYEQADGRIVKRSLSAKGLGRTSRLAKTEPNTPFLVANLSGRGHADLVLGNKIFWRCSSWNTSIWKELATSLPGVLMAGDVNKHGRDDLVRFKRIPTDPDPYTEHDVFLHTTYKESDPDWDFDGLTNQEEARLGTDPRNRDTDNDGLPDGWEVKGIRDFDLAKLGCSPLHKDVICEIKRYDTVKPEDLDKTIASIKKFYANLPITNVDGQGGIHFIALQPEPLTKSEYTDQSWGSINARFCPPQHHGIAHWMSVTPGNGGGQSRQMGDAGGCADGWAVFVHEFGHQLGLPHNGFWNAEHCPIYTSLMNYAYNYSFNGKGDAVHYSDGKFKALVLDEHDLSEVLPFKYDDVKFLSGPPYHYHLKADGTNTLIDWNWNGVFGEQHIKADINYGYSTTAGFRNIMDKSFTSPFLFTHQANELLLVYGKEPAASVPGSEYTPAPASASPSTPPDTNAPPGDEGNRHDLALVFRKFIGDNKWTEPMVLESKGVTGDPAAVSDGKSLWVFYPMAEGVCYREMTAANGFWQPKERELLPDSQGMQATPCLFSNQLYVLLRQDSTNEIKASYKTAVGWSQRQALGFTSTIPVGATADTIKGELIIGCAQDQDANRPSRWQVRRFKLQSQDNLSETSWRWVAGEKGGTRGNTRLTVIFSAAKDAGPEGKLRVIGGGYIPPDSRNNWAGFSIAEQIPDPAVSDGWLVKRYYDEWTNSRSAPSAVGFKDDIVFTYRWVGDSPAYRDNQIHICYSGLGIDESPMGDFNDIDFINRIGLPRSISQFSVRQ